MKLKLKGRRFDSIEEIQTESQDVLNTLTRNDFQQCFRSGYPAGIAALMQKGTTSKGMEANKNFAKWLSCGIQISGTFGLQHVSWHQVFLQLWFYRLRLYSD
jgi:hypothetical protein